MEIIIIFLVHRDMPTFFVVLDACGEVVDFLKLNHFLKRKNSYWESEKLDKVCILIFSPLCKYCTDNILFIHQVLML